MGGDEDMAYFLQRLLGYGITGEVREEIFPVWTGSGRNGKGLLTQALQQLLGAYYKEMNCAVISDSRVCSNIDAERAKLIGARIAVFNELKPGEKLKTNEVQLLTGGDGFPVKAIYKNPVTVMPKHLAILVTNHMPEMSEVIVALVERILAIPFTVTFRDLIPGESETATLRQCDQTMKEKLKSPEGQSALFAWLVEGAVAWYGGTESLKAMAPTKVSEFTRKYLAEQDTVQAFLTDNCELGKTFRESSVALFKMYCEWGLLLDSLCVVDADSDDAVAKIEALQDPDVVEALSVCPIQQTNKGRHYLFIRPEWADAEGYWDGARQVIGFDADLKTRCSTGTRGVLAICPSLNKTWVREPWAAGTKLVDIPRTLMELVAKPKQTKQKKQRSIKVVVNDDIDHESGAPEAFDEVAALVDIIAASRASSYRTWMEVGWCLHNISPTHLPLWELFSKKCPEKYTKGKCGEVWGTMNSDDRAGLRLRLRLGSLHMWARHDSPVEYWDIVSQRVIEDIRTCSGSHNEIARIAKKILGKRIASASTNGKI
eukprot:gene25697-biopygen20194